MTEATAESAATEQQAGSEQTEQQKPSETVEFWKQKAREQEKRAKDNADAAKRLGEIEEAQKSAEQKAAEREAAAIKRAEDAEARATRRDIALEFGLKKEDAAFLDPLTDEEAMRSLAGRLAAQQAEQHKNGNRVRGEGPPAVGSGSGQGGASGPAAEFATFLGNQFGTN